MKAVSLGLVLLAVALSPLGCRNPFADQSFVLGVSNLDAPSAIAPGTAVTVALTFGLNGCDRFDHIGQMRMDSQIVLTPVGTNAALGRKDILCPAQYTTRVYSVVIEDPPAAPFTIAVIQPRGAPPLRAVVARLEP